MTVLSNIAISILFTAGMVSPPSLNLSQPPEQKPGGFYDPIIYIEPLDVAKLAPIEPLDTPNFEPIAQLAYIEPPAPKPATQVSYSSAGNTYAPGNCTWYVKNRRADLPNSLGNANTWYSRAAGLGMSVGSTPRAGAVGATTAGYYGHVVYVEAVNGDGSITISEMNFAGEYSQRTRVASASEFNYIY